MICSSLSTEHGPAMIGTSFPPKRTPGCISTMVLSGRHSRDTCLYGRETAITCATPGIPDTPVPSTCLSLPTRPIAVRCAPGSGSGSYPIVRIASQTASTCTCVASRCITTSMLPSELGSPPVGCERDAPRKTLRHDRSDVHSFHRRVEVCQHQVRRPGNCGERAALLRREMCRQPHGSRQRALSQKNIAFTGPGAEFLLIAGVTGIDEAPTVVLH